MWCITKLTPQHLALMETLLHLYSQPPDPINPLVCIDEKSYQMVDNMLLPLAAQPGKPLRESEKYKRQGTIQIFVAYFPNFGKRFVWLCPTRTAVDTANFLMVLLKVYLPTILPNAKTIRMVSDNLNTHQPGSFYKAFDPQTAFELTKAIRFYHPPVNGSWLNMAEIEIHALSTQCLNRRMGNQKMVTEHLQTLVTERNEQKTKINWQFTPEKARDTFKRFYLNN